MTVDPRPLILSFAAGPTDSLILRIVLITQSSSVFAISGCAARHLVTVLAVPRPLSSAARSSTLEPPKKSTGSVRTPSRSHSRRVKPDSGNSGTAGSTCQSKGSASYIPLEMRFPGISYGPRMSLSRWFMAFCTFAAFGVDGSTIFLLHREFPFFICFLPVLPKDKRKRKTYDSRARTWSTVPRCLPA